MNGSSPCINVCVMDTQTQWCKGCWRTLEEIAAWAQMSDAQRQWVWQQLPLRQQRCGTGVPVQPENKVL